MTNFENFFYHDVPICDLLISINDEKHEIHFLIENEEKQKIKCIFKNVSAISLDMGLRMQGVGCILLAYMTVEDDFLLNFREDWKAMPKIILDKIKCYVISTSFGTIKILSEEDVAVA